MSQAHAPGHDMIEIDAHSGGYGEWQVVRWCPVCGAVSVDRDVDGRTVPGAVTPLQFPKITLAAVEERKRKAAHETP